MKYHIRQQIGKSVFNLIILSILPLLSNCAITTDPGNNNRNNDNNNPYSEYDTSKTSKEWRVLPIKSQEEYSAGKIGGEAEQHPHAIARSYYNPDYIYFTQDVAGAWRSSDGGESWYKTRDNGFFVRTTQSIQVDPVDPNIVFLLANNGWNSLTKGYEGLYRSKDGGENWDFVLKTETNFDWDIHRIDTHLIAYDLSSSSIDSYKPAGTWYAAFQGNGLFRSTNGGESWSKVSDLAGHETVYSVKVDPVDSNIIYLASSSGLFVSYRKGENLEPLGNIPDGGQITSIEINPQNSSLIYATRRYTTYGSAGNPYLTGDGLYRSEDKGKTFNRILEHNVQKVYMNLANPQTLYLTAGWEQMLISHDGGDSWDEPDNVTNFPGFNRDRRWRKQLCGNASGVVTSINDENDAVVYANATIWKTTDNGVNFEESATMFTGNAWSWWSKGAAFDRFNTDRIAFFNCDVGMRLTKTKGRWFEQPSDTDFWDWYSKKRYTYGMGTHAGAFQPVEGSDVIVASIGLYFRTRLMRSDNNGKTWSLVESGSREENNNHNFFISFHSDDPNVVYAGNKISKDAGLTFNKVDFGGLYDFAPPYIVGMCENKADTVYALDGYGQRIARSDNKGETWREYTVPGWGFRKVDPLPTFAVDPFNPDIVYTLDADGDLAVFNGIEWKSTGVLAMADGAHLGNFVRAIAVDPTNPGTIYAGMFATGIPCIYKSTDGGETWKDITLNFPRIGVSAMAVNPNTGELFIGSSIGTWILTP